MKGLRGSLSTFSYIHIIHIVVLEVLVWNQFVIHEQIDNIQNNRWKYGSRIEGPNGKRCYFNHDNSGIAEHIQLALLAIIWEQWAIYYSYEDDDDDNDNDNVKVENISNAEAARIMKSKLGKTSTNPVAPSAEVTDAIWWLDHRCWGRGVRSYAQCGCNVLAKFWRLVGCSKRLDW